MEDTPLLGIFDSGVGGFSVYKQIREATTADVIYYGDCARAPYGNREDSEIISFIKDDIRFLQDEGVTHFVNACNSMSVITTDILLSECAIYSAHYTDMIRALDAHASFETGTRILVIATQATIRSGVYQKVLSRKGCIVSTLVLQELAQMIEDNKNDQEVLDLIKEVFVLAKENKCTHILYGCTHYPLVSDVFMKGKEVHEWSGEFIDPALYVAKEVTSWGLIGERKFTPYSSKDTPAFIKNVARAF